MDDLHIVTVATESDYYFPYLIDSCKKNGKELTVLGYGEKWRGFSWRFKLMIDYLKKLKDTDIVCVIDGYDVVCSRNLFEMKDEFIKLQNKINCKIIISHDKISTSNFLYFLNKIYNNFYFGKCKNINLNAGTYIGYVKDLLEVLLLIYKNNDYQDDQQMLTKYCNMNNDIYIDIENKLFLTYNKPYSEISNLTIINNKIVYNNQHPFFIHAPGGTYLEKTLILLGYDVPNNNIQKKIVKRGIKHLNVLVKKNIFNIILIILLMIVCTKVYKKYVKLLK